MTRGILSIPSHVGYRTSVVIVVYIHMLGSPTSGTAANAPRDARAISALLHGMGIEKYEVDVVHMLLDVLNGHVIGLLHGARSVADHAGKTEIDLEDLRLAAATSRSAPDPPDRAAVLSVARERNVVPFPNLEKGVLLPTSEHCLVPQRGVTIELPRQSDIRPSSATGPWIISDDERKAYEIGEIRRRRAAAAAAP